MARIRTLAKPPIVEALLDVQFSVNSEVTDDEIRSFVDQQVPSGWTKQSMSAIEAKFGPIPSEEGDVPAASLSNRIDGYIVRDPEIAIAIQYRKDRISFSRIKDYRSWESLIAEFEPVFSSVVSFLRPTSSSRIAARFINRIDLPQGRVVVEEFLIAPPLLPTRPDVEFQSFRQQAVLNNVDGFTVAVNVGTAASADKDAFIVDVDVFKSESMGTTFESIRPIFDQIRSVKNEIFFSLVHEKALEAYE